MKHLQLNLTLVRKLQHTDSPCLGDSSLLLDALRNGAASPSAPDSQPGSPLTVYNL